MKNNMRLKKIKYNIKQDVSIEYANETQKMINDYERWVFKMVLSNDVPYSDEVNAYKELYESIVARDGEIPDTIYETHLLFTIHYMKTVKLALHK